jgi:ATP-dependent DNA helicase RecQ
LDRSAVIRHVTLAVRQGKTTDPALLLDRDTLRAWDAWRADRGDAAPPPGTGPVDLWPLYLACRSRR